MRSCVVNAVRESEALMARLVQATTDALGQQEQDPRSSAKRDAAGDARRLLDRHGPALVRGYPMALLEICAEPAARSSASPPPVQGGPSSARLNTPSNTGTLTHFGPQGLSELTLLGEEEVQAQVEMSRAQQQALHAKPGQCLVCQRCHPRQGHGLVMEQFQRLHIAIQPHFAHEGTQPAEAAMGRAKGGGFGRRIERRSEEAHVARHVSLR